MPIQLGARKEHGFDEPLGLMSDCHRRIEKFLEVLIAVVERTGGGTLSGEQRGALEAALRYFAVAAPRHTEDEEASLFPRMRSSNDPAAREALAKMAALEADHRRAEVLHGEVDRIGRTWLEKGQIGAERAGEMGGMLRELKEAYARHISVEDSEVFPLAERVLSAEELKEVGEEMARRRGLEAQGRCGGK